MAKSENTTLVHLYRLQLTESQEQVLETTEFYIRRVWNHLVNRQRYAYGEILHGRTASLKEEYAKLILAKEACGMAVKNAKDTALYFIGFVSK